MTLRGSEYLLPLKGVLIATDEKLYSAPLWTSLYYLIGEWSYFRSDDLEYWEKWVYVHYILFNASN